MKGSGSLVKWNRKNCYWKECGPHKQEKHSIVPDNKTAEAQAQIRLRENENTQLAGVVLNSYIAAAVVQKRPKTRRLHRAYKAKLSVKFSR